MNIYDTREGVRLVMNRIQEAARGQFNHDEDESTRKLGQAIPKLRQG
jgi:hypothetical protein